MFMAAKKIVKEIREKIMDTVLLAHKQRSRITLRHYINRDWIFQGAKIGNGRKITISIRYILYFFNGEGDKEEWKSWAKNDGCDVYIDFEGKTLFIVPGILYGSIINEFDKAVAKGIKSLCDYWKEKVCCKENEDVGNDLKYCSELEAYDYYCNLFSKGENAKPKTFHGFMEKVKPILGDDMGGLSEKQWKIVLRQARKEYRRRLHNAFLVYKREKGDFIPSGDGLSLSEIFPFDGSDKREIVNTEKIFKFNL